VKIRGFRIEMGEIEAQLGLHYQVKQAAVIAREDVLGEKRLVAYVTRRDHNELNVEELRGHLRRMLPEHMVPGAFVIMDSLPLTPSGKLNRRALPPPEPGAYVRDQRDPPIGEVEQTVARLWRELLHVDQVGREDSFFDLGGTTAGLRRC
jgi:hypothetical protein